jgi:hypothetical protein
MLGRSQPKNEQPKQPQTPLRKAMREMLAEITQEIPAQVSGLLPLPILLKSASDMLERQSEENLINGVRVAGVMVRKLEAAIMEQMNADPSQLRLHEGN